MDKINDGLSYIFFSDDRLSIECKEDKYYLLSRGNSVAPEKISTGERNAIALCYFFTDIMQNKDETDVYNDEYLIIIDDPISSFDMENRIGVLSYLRYQMEKLLCGNKNTKILIMVHDLQTFFDMSVITKDIRNVYKKTNNLSNSLATKSFSYLKLSKEKIETLSKEEVDKYQEYTSLLNNIFSYAKNEDYEGLEVGNSMRRVLEAYSTFNYKKGIVDVTRNENIVRSFDDRQKKYFRNLMYRLVLHV